jgi:uncharacterized membrane protein
MIAVLFFYILIVTGVVNALYLYLQYLKYLKDGRPMICPLGGKCEKVVSSRYGSLLGVRNEILGIIYYLLSIAFFSMSLIASSPQLFYIVLTLSILAALYSSFLLVIQIFFIRDLCSWCILSGIINYAALGVLLLILLNWI